MRLAGISANECEIHYFACSAHWQNGMSSGQNQTCIMARGERNRWPTDNWPKDVNRQWQMVNAISSGPIQSWQSFECFAAGAGMQWSI